MEKAFKLNNSRLVHRVDKAARVDTFNSILSAIKQSSVRFEDSDHFPHITVIARVVGDQLVIVAGKLPIVESLHVVTVTSPATGIKSAPGLMFSVPPFSVSFL